MTPSVNCASAWHWSAGFRYQRPTSVASGATPSHLSVHHAKVELRTLEAFVSLLAVRARRLDRLLCDAHAARIHAADLVLCVRMALVTR